jgi:hypothetical protein
VTTVDQNSQNKVEEKDEGMGSINKKVAACAGVFGAVSVIVIAGALIFLVLVIRALL